MMATVIMLVMSEFTDGLAQQTAGSNSEMTFMEKPRKITAVQIFRFPPTV